MIPIDSDAPTSGRAGRDLSTGPRYQTDGGDGLKITLTDEESIHLEGAAGPLMIEPGSPDQSFSPFHMLASSLATCVHSVLYSWGYNAKLNLDDLEISVSWRFVEDPYRVGSYDIELIWPSLPEARRTAAERVAHHCTVHQTLLNPPEIRTHVRE